MFTEEVCTQDETCYAGLLPAKCSLLCVVRNVDQGWSPHVWSISDSTKYSGQHQTARNCISHDLEARAASTFTFTKNSTFSGSNSKTIPISSSELFHYNFDQLINFNMFQLILRYMMNNSILQFQHVSWSMSPAPNVNTVTNYHVVEAMHLDTTDLQC